MKVTIKKMGINGEGIGYIDRLPVFVPGAFYGRERSVYSGGGKKRTGYAKGKNVKILRRSDKRVRPICETCAACGACPYMVSRI